MKKIYSLITGIALILSVVLVLLFFGLVDDVFNLLVNGWQALSGFFESFFKEKGI